MLATMDLLKDLQAKVGLDEDKAKKVLEFLKDNAGSVTRYLGSSLSDLGATFGIGGETMEVITPEEYLRQQEQSDE